jgi:putative SOS response-associated peptidase YedK
MCGRFTLTSPTQSLREAFDFMEIPNLPARTNVAPGQQILAVRLGDADGRTDERPDGRRHAVQLKWGLVPFWADDPAIGNRMINARAESAAEKPAFREAFARRRCLIPADGFYEWKAVGGGARPLKQPYRATLAGGGPFAFAGLWERNTKVAADPLETCTILTTTATPELAHIHHRMPVILPPEALAAWLDPQTKPEALAALLEPWPGEPMRAYPVSTRVNSVANDDLDLLGEVAPLDPEEQAPQPAQGSLF